MSITERVGTGLLVAAVVALLLPFAACSTSDTPPYPVIEVTPVAQVASARAIIATASRQNFMSGDFVIYPVPLASPGVLDILVDWTFPNSWIYVYFGQTKCTYEELEKRTCPFLIASETQLPKPRVLYSRETQRGPVLPRAPQLALGRPDEDRQRRHGNDHLPARSDRDRRVGRAAAGPARRADRAATAGTVEGCQVPHWRGGACRAACC